jgi:hypothetical protein
MARTKHYPACPLQYLPRPLKGTDLRNDPGAAEQNFQGCASYLFTTILAANGLSTQKSGAEWSDYFRLDRTRQYVQFGSVTS